MNFFQQDFVNCINQKPDEMKMIIRAVKRSLDDPDAAKIEEKVFEMLLTWVQRILQDNLDNYDFNLIKADLNLPGKPVGRKIGVLTEEILHEEELNLAA